MADGKEKETTQETAGRRVLVSKTSRNGIILILAVLIVAGLSGLLGAFKNGEFQRTYDFVSVNVAVADLDYEAEIFDQMSKDSRQVYSIEPKIIYDEETNTTTIQETNWYSGYYKSYFFASEWFYLETLFNTVLVMIFYISLINFLISRRQDKDEIYIALSSDINGMIVDNDLPAVKFEPFLDIWNNNRKIKQHIANVKFQISKLIKKTPYRIRKVFDKKDDKGNILFVFPAELHEKIKFYHLIKLNRRRRQLKFYQKKTILESKLTKSYIENTVVFEKVKYFKQIDPSFIYSGKNGLHKTTDEYSSIQNDGKVLSKDLRKKVLVGFSITMMITSILAFTMFKATDDWIVIVYMVALRMLPLVLQTIMGIDYSNSYMQKQLIPTIKYRLSIASVFLANDGKMGIFDNIPFLEIKQIIEEPKKAEEPKPKFIPRLEDIGKNLVLKEVS